MSRVLIGFVKLTGWPVQWLCFRTKVSYENRAVQSRRIKGSAIVVSNHTALYDYAVLLFVFFGRVLRTQMAELLFKKGLLGPFLKGMGGIYVDRDSHNMGFVEQSVRILERGGVLCVFPEARLAREGETRPLPFQTSPFYIALESGAPIIPVYTNGSYFQKKRARVRIGTPIDARAMWRPEEDEKTNLLCITEAVRQKVIELGRELEREQA
ncbi:MAG: 1-acyl-sn-glycerol-3-phosphate acyltransferase [Clostridia bacterium]|nr:1-acyl-sn-glycerol-3-phosphate acyltransferase [Clostridia bacterium]